MNLFTVTQVATELGVKPVRIRQLCQQGRVKGAEKLGSTWVIPKPINIAPGTRGPRLLKVKLNNQNSHMVGHLTNE